VRTHFKATRSLLQSIRRDLARPHPFAFERVGFVAASISASKEELLVLAQEYRPVLDEDYLDDPTVGAMMGPEAIRKALQWALSQNVGLFHIHSHGGRGRPGFSRIDLREQARFVPSFFQVAGRCAHGAIVLSNTQSAGNIWMNEDVPPRPIDTFTEVGAPLSKWTLS
jgi:hypothetical protein